MKKIFILIVMTLMLCGCGSKSKESELETGKITCNQMKEIMANDDKAMLIDVRNEDEYESGHLDGAINIKYSEIVDTLDSQKIDKDTKIIVYCQSGNRSNVAYTKLIDDRYTKVYDLGSINNCK